MVGKSEGSVELRVPYWHRFKLLHRLGCNRHKPLVIVFRLNGGSTFFLTL
jgi:hypothetical protein